MNRELKTRELASSEDVRRTCRGNSEAQKQEKTLDENEPGQMNPKGHQDHILAGG